MNTTKCTAVSAAVALMCFGASAYATNFGSPSSNANANAGASAGAAAIDNSTTVIHNNPQNTNSANAGARSDSLSISGGGQGGQGIGLGGSASASAGVNFQPRQSFTFEASKIPPPGPGVLGATGSQPELFTNPWQRGHVRGLPLVAQYLQRLKPSFTGQSVIDRASTEDSRIVFWPNPESYAQRRYEQTGSSWCSPDDYDESGMQGCQGELAENGELEPVHVRSVTMEMPKNASGIPLGIINAEAKPVEQGSFTPVTVVMSDVINYVRGNLEGYASVTVVTLDNLIGYGLQVQNEGSGMGVSPGLSAVNSAMDVVGSIVGGFGSRNGQTEYNFMPGMTALLIANVEDPSMVTFDFGQTLALHRGNGESGNGTKMKAAEDNGS